MAAVFVKILHVGLLGPVTLPTDRLQSFLGGHVPSPGPEYHPGLSHHPAPQSTVCTQLGYDSDCKPCWPKKREVGGFLNCLPGTEDLVL